MPTLTNSNDYTLKSVVTLPHTILLMSNRGFTRLTNMRVVFIFVFNLCFPI